MSKTFEIILKLVQQNQILISDHGYDELAADDIYIKDIVYGLNNAKLVEDYPDYPKGPVCESYKKMLKRSRFMLCGAFQRGRHLLL
jgi:hypothetical protein